MEKKSKLNPSLSIEECDFSYVESCCRGTEADPGEPDYTCHKLVQGILVKGKDPRWAGVHEFCKEHALSPQDYAEWYENNKDITAFRPLSDVEYKDMKSSYCIKEMKYWMEILLEKEGFSPEELKDAVDESVVNLIQSR